MGRLHHRVPGAAEEIVPLVVGEEENDVRAVVGKGGGGSRIGGVIRTQAWTESHDGKGEKFSHPAS